MLVPLTPIDFKRRAVQLYGSKIGVVDGNRRFTYAEFGQRCDRLAAALLQRGLKRGERVAYIAYNSYPLLEGYFGVLEAGGVLLPINIRLIPDEIAIILNHASVSFLLVDADFIAVVDAVWDKLEAKPHLVWLTSRPEGRDEELYDEMLDSVNDAARSSVADPGSPASLYPGFPVPQIHENDVAGALTSVARPSVADPGSPASLYPGFPVPQIDEDDVADALTSVARPSVADPGSPASLYPGSPVPQIDENDVAELFYTSGTTGRPKGVMLTHRNLYLHALSTLIGLGATESDVQLHTIPLFHVNGWGTPQYLTALGGTHVMLRRFDPGEALWLIEKERVTRFLVVPTMLSMILNHPDIGKYDLSSLRLINIGGAPTPPEMLRRAQEILGCDVIGGYGLSETSPVITLANDKSYLQNNHETVTRRASTGLPVIGVDLRIVDDSGNDLPWDGESVGEIAVRGNVVMKGYLDDDKASKAAIRDGWFYTGDMAVVDPEGYVLIVDRKKDIIISGGENISSVEVEKLLYEHPAVLESAVISAPDERWGEVPIALVVLRPQGKVTAEELIDFCRKQLATFKVPKSIEFLDSLPKGGTGKILKRQLREPYWQEQQKRVH